MKSAYALLFCTLIVAGCDRIVGDRVTGLGRLDGTQGRASVGFNADGCDPIAPTGQVQYDDHDREVKFHGDVLSARQCVGRPADCPVCDPLRVAFGFPLTAADYEVRIEYRSSNPADPGEGTAQLCFTDNGEGATSSDNSIVTVETGPYAGYQNYGSIRGNIQQHECPSGQ